jgi:hypothetical protein
MHQTQCKARLKQQSVHPGQKSSVTEPHKAPDQVSNRGRWTETENQTSFSGGQVKTTTVTLQFQIGVNPEVVVVSIQWLPRAKLRPNGISGAAG